MKIRRGHRGIVLLIDHVGIAFLGIRASHTGDQTISYDTYWLSMAKVWTCFVWQLINENIIYSLNHFESC